MVFIRPSSGVALSRTARRRWEDGGSTWAKGRFQAVICTCSDGQEKTIELPFQLLCKERASEPFGSRRTEYPSERKIRFPCRRSASNKANGSPVGTRNQRKHFQNGNRQRKKNVCVPFFSHVRTDRCTDNKPWNTGRVQQHAQTTPKIWLNLIPKNTRKPWSMIRFEESITGTGRVWRFSVDPKRRCFWFGDFAEFVLRLHFKKMPEKFVFAHYVRRRSKNYGGRSAPFFQRKG